MERNVGKNDKETDEGGDERDADVGSISNGTLDGSEDGTTGDTHDKDTGTATGVDTKVLSTEGEDSGVHGSHEEVDGHDSTNRTLAVTGADVGVEGNADKGVEDHDESGAEDGGKSSGDEAADGEGDQSVGKEVGSSGLSPAAVVDSVVEEEGTDGNLGANVAELGNETTEHVVLLPDAALTDLTALKIVLGLDERVVALGLLSDLGKLSEDEQDGNGDTEASHAKVDELNVGKIVGVLAGEESLGGDEGTDEGSNTVPGLAELETRRGGSRVTNDNGVRVGSSLEGGKTTSNDKSASAETTEGGRGVGL